MTDKPKAKVTTDSTPEKDSKQPDANQVEQKDNTPEQVGKVVNQKQLDETATGGAKKNAKQAGENANESKEALAQKDLDKSQVAFDDMMTDEMTEEDALNAINAEGPQQYTLEDGKLVPVPVEAPVEDATEEDEATDESTEEGTEKLSKSDQEFVDATIKQMIETGIMKDTKEGREQATRLAMVLLPIHRAIQSFRGPEGDATEESDEKSGEGDKEKADDKVGDDKEEGGDASGDVVDESADKLDPTTVQNPKEEADKIRASAEGLQKNRTEVDVKIQELVGKDGVTSKETGPMDELVDELKEIDKKIGEIEAKAVPFDEELERRANIVDTTWQNASEGSEDGLISGVTLDTADGDNLVISVKDPAMVATVTAIAASFGTGVSVNEAGQIVLEDVPHGQITGEGPLGNLMDALAAIPAPAVSDDAEDKEESDEGAEDKERSPEVIKDALNVQLEALRQSNPDFMREAPIGRVFAAMSYEANEAGEIIVTIPSSVSADYRAIMTANKREIKNGSGTDYTVSYPDGTEIEMAGEKAGDYPSRLAWGGVEGDAESQFSAAESGMNMWKSSISTDLPDDVTMVEPSGEEPVLDGEPEGDAAKVKTELASLQNSLGEHAGDTHFGKFIASLDVGSSEGATVLTSKGLTAEQFSHMYEQIGLGDKVASLTESASDGYVMVLKENTAANIVHNLGRWAAMMGSKTESTLESGGDLGEGTEVAENEGEPAPDSGADLLTGPEKIERLRKLKDWAKRLDARAVALDYSVDVTVDEENLLLVVTAHEDDLEGAAEDMDSIQKEAIPRAIITVLSADGKSLTLDIDRRTDELGYLGKGITNEEFKANSTEEEKGSPVLGSETERAMANVRSLMEDVDNIDMDEAGNKKIQSILKDITAAKAIIKTETDALVTSDNIDVENEERQEKLATYIKELDGYEESIGGNQESTTPKETPDETFNQKMKEFNTRVLQLSKDVTDGTHTDSRRHPMGWTNISQEIDDLTEFVNGVDIPEGRNLFELRLRRVVRPLRDGLEYFVEYDANEKKMIITPPQEEEDLAETKDEGPSKEMQDAFALLNKTFPQLAKDGQITLNEEYATMLIEAGENVVGVFDKLGFPTAVSRDSISLSEHLMPGFQTKLEGAAEDIQKAIAADKKAADDQLT